MFEYPEDNPEERQARKQKTRRLAQIPASQHLAQPTLMVAL
jgi:hypothetical protein